MNKIWEFFKPLPDASMIQDPEKVKKMYKYWRIRTFLALYIGYCGFYLTRKNISPALHIFSEELGIGMVDLGIIAATFSITYGVGKLFAGIIADKANVRAFMAIGLLLSSIVNLFYGFLTNLWALAFFWGINGFCQATGYPPIAKSLVHWFSPTERAEKWSWWSSSHTAGTFAAGALVALLIKYSPDWRAVFYMPGILGIIISIYIFWSLRDTPKSVGLPAIEEYRNDPLPVSVENKEKTSQWTILKKYVFTNPYVWYLSLALCLVYFVRFGTLDWATKFLYDDRGFDKDKVAWLWNLMPLFGMPGGIIAGWLSTKFFKGRCAPMTIFYLVVVSFAVYGYYVFAGPAHIWLTCLFIAMIGFFIDGPQVLIGGVMLSRVTAQESAAAAAGFSGFWSYILGTAVGANLLAALLVEKYGWGAMYAACIVCAIGAIVFTALCWKKESTEPAKK